MTSQSDDLFFDALVRGYVEDNSRFLRRGWLAAQLDETLREDGSRFVLLTAVPGAGKTAFISQLAHDHPDWLRYFVRRDQRSVLADVSDKSLFLRIGYQLAARHAELFTPEQLRLSVVQRIAEMGEQAEAVGAEVKRLAASPFYQRVLVIEQHVGASEGKLVGLRVEELVVETRMLATDDLLHLALIHPARALLRIAPSQQIIILIDALDEIRYHQTTENILAWLTNCPELPNNIRFVLTSRPSDDALNLFRTKQAAHLAELIISEEDPHVKQDIESFVSSMVGEPALSKALEQTEGGAEAFARKTSEKANGNLGYLDALARGIDRAIDETQSTDKETRVRGRGTLAALLGLKELPADLEGLYAFFLHQIKTNVNRERIELKDPESGEIYDKPIWPSVYDRILGVLAVAMEPLDLALIEQLGRIRAERSWILQALDRLIQFLEVTNRQYRLYHATVAEFLTSTDTRDDKDNSDLYVEPQRWHRQIADHFLDAWGTLEKGLPHLDDQTRTLVDDGYGLRRLVVHLRSAGRVEDLVALLRARRRRTSDRGPVEENVWYKVRDRFDDLPGYLNDLTLASATLGTSNRIEIEDGRIPLWLSEEIRCSLMMTSVTSQLRDWPPELIAELVAQGLWRPSRGLIYVRELPELSRRTRGLMLLLRFVDGSTRQQVVTDVLETIADIPDPFERQTALKRVAPELTAALISRAVNIARREGDTRYHAWALVDLVENVPPELREAVFADALEAVRFLEPSDRSSKLGRLADLALETMQSRLIDEALEAARESGNAYSIAGILAESARHAPAASREDALQQAVYAIRAIPEPQQRGAFGYIAPELTPATSHSAIALAREIKDSKYRIAALVALIPSLHGPARENFVREILQEAHSLFVDSYRAEALSLIAPELPVSSRDQIVREVLGLVSEVTMPFGPGVDGTKWRWDVVKGCVAIVPEDEVAGVLALVAALSSFDREAALSACLPHVPATLHGEVLTIIGSLDRPARVRQLLGLARIVPAEHRRDLLAEAVAVASKSEDDSAFARLRVRLATCGPDHLLGRGLECARGLRSPAERVSALTDLIQRLPARMREEVGEEAYRTIWEMPDIGLVDADSNRDRSVALGRLAPYLSESLLSDALTRLGSTANDEYNLVRALSRLAPHLPDGLKLAGLELGRTVKGEGWRAYALAHVTPLVPRLELTLHLHTALAAQHSIQSLWDLAQYLPEQARLDAFRSTFDAIKEGLDKEGDRSWPWLLYLPAHLPPLLVPDALTLAESIKDDGYRLRALAQIVPRLSGPARARKLEETLRAVRAAARDFNATVALVDLARHLPDALWEDVLPEALEAALSLKHHSSRPERTKAFERLIPRLEQLAPPVLYAVWSQALSAFATRKRVEMLHDLEAWVPVVVRLTGRETIGQAFDIVDDVAREWP